MATTIDSLIADLQAMKEAGLPGSTPIARDDINAPDGLYVSFDSLLFDTTEEG